VEDILVGILALCIGAVFCFNGYLAMRIVIPIWGAFAGFVLGAGAVASFDDNEFLSTVLGWFLGIVIGLLFALIAYLYYEFAVVLAFASIGFTLGTGLMTALNIDWDWLVILVGIVVGVILAIIAIVAEMPMVILVLLSTVAGAITMTVGAMLLVGQIETGDWNSNSVIDLIDDDWWWWAIAITLMAIGLLSQMRTIAQLHWSTRAAWDESAAGRRP
jgi:hypothetical protein